RLLDEVLAEFRQSFPDCLFSVTSTFSSAQVFGDSGLLKTALRKLLDNARKYRYPSMAPIEVELASNADTFTLTVRNAIDPEKPLNRAELFERYVRGGTRGNRSGLGLGLYLVQRILHDHGGQATIGQGQTNRFEICLILPRPQN
ncbi:MAG: hypothetical protein HQL31_07170, partial [Planctomycetes bacterium]|nr:hypothetical protein [Planctomycetota bacterium]